MFKRIPVKELLIATFAAILGGFVTQYLDRTQPKPLGQSVSISHAYHRAIGDVKVPPPKKPKAFVGLGDEDWKVYEGDEDIQIELLVDGLYRTRQALLEKRRLWESFLGSYKQMIDLLKGPRTQESAIKFFSYWNASHPAVFEIITEKWKRGTYNKQVDPAINNSPNSELLELEKDTSMWPGGWLVKDPYTKSIVVPKSDNADINGYFAKSLARFDPVALRIMVDTASEDKWYLRKIEEALRAVERHAIQYARIVVEIIVYNRGAKGFSVLPTAELELGSPMTTNGKTTVIPAIVCSSEDIAALGQPCHGVTVSGGSSVPVFFVSKQLMQDIGSEPPIGRDKSITVLLSLQVEPPPGIFGGKVNATQELESHDLNKMWQSAQLSNPLTIGN